MVTVDTRAFDGGGTREHVLEWIWLASWGLASTLWCWTAADAIGLTFDEPTYIAVGLERWRTGHIGELMRLGTMPLPVDLATVGVYLWERIRDVPFAIGTDGHGHAILTTDLHLVIRVARAATLPFLWLLLYYGWRSGRRLAGPWGGRLAVALLACQPTILAHASLATTDIAVTACLLALTYHVAVGREAGWRARIGTPALWFALALLSKVSALVIGPLCIIAVEWTRARSSSTPSSMSEQRRWWLDGWRATRAASRDGGRIVGLGVVMAFVYCGSDWELEPSFVRWADSLPADAVSAPMRYLAHHLAIFSNAGEGVVQQISHNIRGHGAYLLGRTYERAVWYYFPVALLIKLALPMLVAPVIISVVRARALANWAIAATALILLASVFFRVQTGVRFLLPLMALLSVGLAAAIVDAVAAVARDRLRLALLTVASGVIGVAAGAVSVWPHGLSFTNVLWGGTARGHLYLSDSNYDWGQGLPELEAWQIDNDVARLGVWYWGTDPHLANGPWDPMPLHLLPVRTTADLMAHLRGRRLAVSTTLLYGSVLAETRPAAPEIEAQRAAAAAARSLFRGRTPVGRTTTYLIYDFRGD